MPNSQIKQIFEFCKNGNTKQLLDALNDSNESLVLDDRQNSVLSMALKSSQWPTAEALIQNNFIYFHSNQPGLISASQCKNDDDTGIRLALKLTDNINCKNKHQRTALMTACLLGHVNKAKELLKNNADVSLQDIHGNTALMDAIQSKNKKMVGLIIKQKPDIDQINNQGETALILELKLKSPTEDIVTQLLNAGSNPELVDKSKKSAWLIAKQKHPKLSRLIEIHLNNVNQIELPFFSNDYLTNDSSVEKTENHADPKKLDYITPEKTKLESKTKAVENIIDDASIDSNEPRKNDNRIEPSFNLKSKDETNSQTSHSHNVDNNSIKKDSQKIIEPSLNKPYFFNKKAKQSNKQEWFHAAKTGNLGGLNRMLIEGIDIDCIDEKGCTALIRASGHSRRAVVSFLLQQNANIEARSTNGSTALSSSIIGNCRRVAGLLLDNGANVNALGPADYPYVTIAAAQWNDAMLSILYRNGGDIFVINKMKQSLLHIIALAAEFYNNVNNAKTSIQYLLDHGMDINLQDNNGDTALMILCGSHKHKYEVDDRNIASIAHCLIKMGAAAAITNKAGKSALDVCRQHKLVQTKGVIMNALSWND